MSGRGAFFSKTRMHSSRMLTGRSLTACWRGGLPGPGGSAWSWGVCLVPGGLPGLGGVSGTGGDLVPGRLTGI